MFEHNLLVAGDQKVSYVSDFLCYGPVHNVIVIDEAEIGILIQFDNMTTIGFKAGLFALLQVSSCSFNLFEAAQEFHIIPFVPAPSWNI